MPSLNAAGASDLVTEYEWPNGDAIVASALSNGPTFLFVEWALALRLNRKTRRKMTQLCAARAARPRPRWYKMFCKQIWHLYVQLRHLAAPRKRLRERTSLSLSIDATDGNYQLPGLCATPCRPCVASQTEPLHVCGTASRTVQQLCG